MKVSTKGRYGVRFMMDLAVNGQGGRVNLRQIGKRQNISWNYLWQIVNRLKSAGLIRATAGSKGGYSLAMAPQHITLGKILMILEGDIGLVPAAREPASCTGSNACAAREIWAEVNDKIAAVLESITLEDMARKQLEMAQSSTTEYSI